MLLFVRLTSIFDWHYLQSEYAWQFQQEKLSAFPAHSKTCVDHLDADNVVARGLLSLGINSVTTLIHYVACAS